MTKKLNPEAQLNVK